MPLLFEDGRWNATLVGLTPRDAVEGTAYKALYRRLEALTHVELPLNQELPIQLRVGRVWEDTLPEPRPSLSPEGFRIRVGKEAVTLVGGSPKGTLNAVYEFLERLGIRWPVAAPGSVIVPEQPIRRMEIEEMDVVIEPSFPRITFFQDLRTLRDYTEDEALASVQNQNDRDLVNWMGRQRFTGLYGNLPEAPEPWSEAERRGIRRQAGGHVLPRLLPRDLFALHPDYFPMNEEGRRFPGNVCASSEEALQIICRNARMMADQTSAEVLHLWGEDVMGGKWCSCPECKVAGLHNQYLRVVNAVADALAETHPDLKIGYIAYHDTLVPKLTAAPRPNVVLLFAPRQRCYRHTLAEADCARNAEIYDGLLKYREIFGEGRLHTFEYYGDALLWCSAAIVLPRLIAEDVRTYHQAGVTDSGCLMFGGYSWFSHPLNLYAFARMSWDASRTAEEIVAEFCKEMYPGAEEGMQRYYVALEDAARLLVERPDWFYRVPKDDPEAALKLWEETEAIQPAWEALTEAFSAAATTARPRAGESLIRERQALRFSQHMVRAYRHRIRAAALPAMGESGVAQGVSAAERNAEMEIRLALRLLHDLSPYQKGSWGAERNGESRRLHELLNDPIHAPTLL